MIIVQTPLRISFLGGGSDFDDFSRSHQGVVISTAIDKYTFVIVKERYDDLIRINYSERETEKVVSNIKHGLVREAMKLTGVTKGIEITTLADIPSEGTGLGSSSSITVGLLQALYAYQGQSVTAEKLASEACQIEIDILKRPIGKQDQVITAYGNFRNITFFNGNVTVQKIEMSKETKRKLNENLLVFYTGITRQSSDVLTEQKNNIKDRLPILIEMVNLANEGRQYLNNGELDEFGKLLHRSWELKKQLASKVSNSGIDELYSKARQAGALGGKITGAGGGGFLLLYCPSASRDNVRASLSHLRELPFQFEKDGSKVIFNYRRNQ